MKAFFQKLPVYAREEKVENCAVTDEGHKDKTNKMPAMKIHSFAGITQPNH